MAEEERKQNETPETSHEDRSQQDGKRRASRRWLLRAGVAAAPVVLTLRGRAAFGQPTPGVKISGGFESGFEGSPVWLNGDPDNVVPVDDDRHPFHDYYNPPPPSPDDAGINSEGVQRWDNWWEEVPAE